jgi:exopolyphosphatase / guanosine-5'-triphosphate,3'-diphosphate pyrophosphatase
MPVNSPPLLIAALDAGSNAIRAVVARASSATEIRELANARWTVRLGHGVFTRRRLDSRTMSRAVETFVQFRNMLDRYGVAEYSAVATSAVREAANRDALVSRILREAGIELTAISPAEEARLVREAVFAAAGGRFAPRAIIDLGGGSLEISFLRGRKVEHALALPLGTVRLMEMFDQAGSFTPESFARLRRYIMSMLRSHGRAVSPVGRAAVVACGGNAEALARLAAGPRVAGFNTLSLQHLAERLWGILGLGVEERMESLGVRRDRAEVIGVAAVVFNTLGEWLGARQMVVPGVGVREGILHDLAAAHFGPATAHDERAEGLRQQARRFAARMHSEAAHCEHVRRLAAQLFDQLAAVHGLPPSQRVPLELGALLHEVGFAVNARDYHKHGEYLVRNGDIPGLGRHQQALVACLVRYQAEASPKPHHRLYGSLAPGERDRVRQLTALLRIAVALDAHGTQTVRRIEIRVQGKTLWLRVAAAPDARVDFRELRAKSKLLEKEFGVRVQVGRARRPHPALGERFPRAGGGLGGIRRPPASLPRRSAA